MLIFVVKIKLKVTELVKNRQKHAKVIFILQLVFSELNQNPTSTYANLLKVHYGLKLGYFHESKVCRQLEHSFFYRTSQFNPIAKYSKATYFKNCFEFGANILKYLTIFFVFDYIPISNLHFYFFRFQSIDFHANDKDFGHS